MLTILNPDAPFPTKFPKGALLLVDKPLGWTSFDVVNKVRFLLTRRLGTKKLKVGHAGTLDPLATGLLLLCVGEYTKKINAFQEMPKAYTGVLTFGATTPSFDLEKPVDTTYPADHLSDEGLQQLLPQFIGDIEQIPPVFSAVKVDGRRLYKNARTGQTVELPFRQVRVSVFELGPLHPVEAEAHRTQTAVFDKKGVPIYLHPDYPKGRQCAFRIECSKGTYIRSLANDLGQAAGSGAYLSSLCRTQTGGYSIGGAHTIEQIEAWARKV